MRPFFNPGDKLVINRWAYLFSPPKKGDIIAFQLQNKSSTILLKKVGKVSKNKLFVVGLNPADSLDSRKLGLISKDQVLGKVLTKY